jgi:hypothetical protein
MFERLTEEARAALASVLSDFDAALARGRNDGAD